MKKIIYSFAIISIFLTSCNDAETNETTHETQTENSDITHQEGTAALPAGWEMTQNESITYLAIRDSVSGDEWVNFSTQLGENYGQIVEYMTANNIDFAGMPLTQWFTFDESGTSIYTAGIPVASGTIAGEGMEIVIIPAGNAYKYVHLGAYEETEAAHNAINQYMYSTGNPPTGAPWEIYVTDPGMETDTSKWVTEIWYPIAG